MTLVVCAVRQLPELLALHTPSHVLTLTSPGLAVPTISHIPPERHLVLQFNDISAPTTGLVAPDNNMVQAILDFSRSWDRRETCLVHCWAGISRSTAAAFIITCANRSPGQEDALAHDLRRASPSATPNPLMIKIADELLRRSGAMVAAIKMIGRGEEASEGRPFLLAG